MSAAENLPSVAAAPIHVGCRLTSQSGRYALPAAYARTTQTRRSVRGGGHLADVVLSQRSVLIVVARIA